MELTANVWPVVDSRSGLVQRFFIRAYTLEVSDDAINRTLRALAPHDFRLARMFAIPHRFKLVTEHGTLSGCVALGDFHAHQFEILEPVFGELEKDHAKFQGIAVEAPNSAPTWVGQIPRFPQHPYLLVTTIIELPDGSLVPHLTS